MSVNVSWYGERGIVNAVVAGLINAGVGGVVSFLKQVEWGGAPPQLGEITSVELIVEMGCGEFGDPDLIIICKSEKEVLLATFVEVKVIPYEVSAGSNQQGMRVKGYNSTINGQLSLKYRLAMALSQWNGPDNELREPDKIYDAYRCPGAQDGLGDMNTRARHLKKSTVLHMLSTAGLAKLKPDQFRFVAWTWDSKAFFQREDFGNSDHRPLFLDNEGQENWNITKSKLGWIGFQQIANAELLKCFLGHEFHNACNTIMVTWGGEVKTDSGTNNGFEPIEPKPYNIQKKCSNRTIEQLQTLENLAAKYFTIKRKRGSLSIKYIEKVILKLVPRDYAGNEYILLGVSASLGRTEWGGHLLEGMKLIGVGTNRQPFYTIDLPRTDEATEIAHDIFRDVAEVLGVAVSN